MRAGIDGLAPAAYLDPPAARALRAGSVFLHLHISTLASLTAGDTSAVVRDLVSGISLAHREGVTLVFGTDAGLLPHGQQVGEFEALARAGIPSRGLIRAATVNAARSLRLADSVGTVEPRMVADIMAVEGNPLTDATSLGRVRFVMSR